MASPAPSATLAARKRRAVSIRHSISCATQASNLAEGIYSAGKANLGFEDVPDAGHYPLVQQHVAYLFVAMLEQARRCFISGKRATQQIGSQPGDSRKPLQSARGVKAGDRHVEGDCQQIIRAQDYAHVAASTLPPLPYPVDVPAATHQHVRGQDEIAGEMDEQPFAARLHSLDDAAGHRALIVHAGQRRIGSLKDP